MSDPWYKNGLKFGCTQCGQCCTGEPGYVWVSEEEIEAMASFLKIPLDEFFHLYIREINGAYSLKEMPNSYDCVLLKEGNKCRVYGARPKQCRTFPFWPENLSSKEAWQEAARRCEGIEHDEAPIIPLSEIQKQLDDMKE